MRRREEEEYIGRRWDQSVFMKNTVQKEKGETMGNEGETKYGDESEIKVFHISGKREEEGGRGRKKV